MYGYEWTGENGIFRLTVEANLEKEIRPVFKEELDYFGMNQYWDYPDTNAPLLWAEGIRRYVINGQCVAEAIGGGFYTKPHIKIYRNGISLQPIDISRLWQVNADLLTGMQQHSIKFIQETYLEYKKKGYAFTVAFSGGKDSLVLLDLAAHALAPKDFYVVFSNTGMELSDTLAAVEKAKQHWNQLDFREAKCHMDPEQSWDEFGPPGRRMRWCCAVHKSVPTILKLREITGDYDVKAVVFDGVRAEESARRAKYDEISIGAKNINQVNCSPIFKWNTAELYCHLLHEDILFNMAYKKGLFRVGCKVCPMSSDWWDGIANDRYRAEMEPLLKRVVEYAQNTKPEDEVKKYIEGGGWKARMGGRGLPNGGNRIKERIYDDNLEFTIDGPQQNWDDTVKMLGPTVGDETDQNKVQKIGKLLLNYSCLKSENSMTVTYWPLSRMDKYTLSRLRGVANKVAYCIGCRACEVQCPTGAFIITADRRISIRESLCVHCENCVTFTYKGCLVAKSLSTTQGENGMDMKGMNRYQHFGLRRQWLEHFFEYKTECFNTGMLGTRQYDALKVWMKESGILSKTGEVTPMGEKLIEMGAYANSTWAVIWANLCYNSVICKWYALYCDVDSNLDKNDLINMLGEEYNRSTRDNAITSLVEIFKSSPIGSDLCQGMQITVGSKSSIYRKGWDHPDAGVMLYALYLYAEATGRYSFTLTELNRCKSNPNGPGMSPADIFGIDTKDFRDILQGMSLAYDKEKYIRVSFVGDLDNIILRNDISSIQVLDLIRNEID